MRWPATAPSSSNRRSLLHVFTRLLILLLLHIGNVHQHPGPPPLPSVSVLSWNCNGIRTSAVELASYLDARRVKIACLQETKLRPNSKLPRFPNYAAVRCDRPAGGGGGLLTLIHHSVCFKNLPTPIDDGTTESIAIKALFGDVEIQIVNIYIPPLSSCPPNYRATLLPLLSADTLIIGDINGHSDLWSPGNQDIRGEQLSDELENNNFIVLNNPDTATRPSSGSSPDISAASSSVALNFDWNVHTTLNSDHLPLALCLDDDVSVSRPRRAFTNFRRANWENFKGETEEKFAALPPPSSCSEGEKIWRKVISSASSHHIPTGYRQNFAPGLNPESIDLAKERDEIRTRDPNDPSLPDINERLAASIADSSRKRWEETLMEADRKSSPKNFWGLLRGLSGKRSHQAPNQPISFHGKVFTKATSTANAFCKHYVNIKVFKSDRASRARLRNIKINNPLDRNQNPFTTANTVDAIRFSKGSTACGPNNISMVHLKHLGPLGIRYLTKLFNLSVNNAEIPAIWRSADVIPVLKPGKPADQGTSYRPISLLCPEVKVLERMMLPSINSALVPRSNQHGFRPGRSTLTALLPLATNIARGFNEAKPAARTGLLSVDLSRAFDIVRRDLLLEKIDATGLDNNLKRWLAVYLSDRKSRVVYQGATSKFRKVELGLPQGAVSSPPLYNFFEKDLEVEATESEAFADDNEANHSSKDIDEISGSLNVAGEELARWTEENCMEISASKSTSTLFTPWSKEVNKDLGIQIGGVDVPPSKNPKHLGVVFDPTFTFSAHASAIARRAAQRLNLLKALSGTRFGKDKETLLMTWRIYIRSILNYAAPIVHPNYSVTSHKKLQLVQNRALRICLGCHSASAVDHLHREAKELMVADHLKLLSAQFLAKCLQPHHPSHLCVRLPRGRRSMKHTLQSKVSDVVQPYLNADGVIEPGTYKATIDSIHTDIVSDAISRLAPNRILNCAPPVIDNKENYLPRITRATLAQLRSGFCSRLNDYQFKIGERPNDLCPECGTVTHSSQHLFECPSFPTNLSVEDLWTNTWAVASFLSTLPSFDFLPSPGPPPPPPPRRRRRLRPPPLPPEDDVFSPVSLPPSPFIFLLLLSLLLLPFLL